MGQSCLGSPPSQDPLCNLLDWAKGLRRLAWSPGGHVSHPALAGVQALRGQGSETGWPGPGRPLAVLRQSGLFLRPPLSPSACLPHLLGSRWVGARARSEAGWLVPSVPGPKGVEPGSGSADSTAPQKGVRLGCLPGALGPAWGGVAGDRGEGAASKPGKLSQMGVWPSPSQLPPGLPIPG